MCFAGKCLQKISVLIKIHLLLQNVLQILVRSTSKSVTFRCFCQGRMKRGGGGGGAAAPPKIYKGGRDSFRPPQKIIEFTQFTINAVKFETESI